jgi:Protein of unknown function (DUF3237)
MMNRREVFGAVSLAGLTAVDMAAAGQAAVPALPPGARTPTIAFLYESIVTLAPTLEFGRTIDGTRRVIPITGGTFEGPRLRGTVLAGGADWNLSRNDGAGSVDASYYLRTHDEVLIRITNQGVGAARPASAPDPDVQERFFMFTSPRFEAPVGPYDWLNRGTYIGTLGARKAVSNAVLIRVFQVI